MTLHPVQWTFGKEFFFPLPVTNPSSVLLLLYQCLWYSLDISQVLTSTAVSSLKIPCSNTFSLSGASDRTFPFNFPRLPGSLCREWSMTFRCGVKNSSEKAFGRGWWAVGNHLTCTEGLRGPWMVPDLFVSLVISSISLGLTRTKAPQGQHFFKRQGRKTDTRSISASINITSKARVFNRSSKRLLMRAPRAPFSMKIISRRLANWQRGGGTY